MQMIRTEHLRLNKEKLTILICTITIFLAQVSERTGLFYYLVLGYGLSLAWGLFCNAHMLAGMILFFLADNNILDIGGVAIQLILMCIYLLRCCFLKRRPIYMYTLIAGIAIALYSLQFINLGLGDVLQGAKLAVMVIFYTEYMGNEQSASWKNYENLLTFAVVGVVVSIIAAILVNPSILSASRFALSDESNWNLLGILSALLFCHCFMMYFIVRQNTTKYFIFSAVMIACSLLTTSRTALLVNVVGAIWILMFIKKNKSKNRKVLVIFVLIVFALLLFTGMLRISYVDKLIDRIVHPRGGDITNGRLALWSYFIHYLMTHPSTLLLGRGTTMAAEGIAMNGGVYYWMAHNIALEQLYMYGILGTLIILFLYVFSFRRIIRCARRYARIHFRWKYIITILLVFLAGMFSHIITSVLVTTELYLGFMQYLNLSCEQATLERGESGYE